MVKIVGIELMVKIMLVILIIISVSNSGVVKWWMWLVLGLGCLMMKEWLCSLLVSGMWWCRNFRIGLLVMLCFLLLINSILMLVRIRKFVKIYRI